MGRPSSYTVERGVKIAKAIARSRRSLNYLHKKFDWFPSPTTIFRWLEKHQTFRDQYALARRAQAARYGDEQIAIADDILTTVKKSHANPGKLSAMVNASKLRIESRRWAASRLAPKDWGDRLEASLKHELEGDIDQLADELASLASRDRKKRSDSKSE